jgi:hypothetical protein
MFVRAVAAADGSTRVTIGGLARSDAAGGFEAEFATLADLLRAELGATDVTTSERELAGLAGPAESTAAADEASSPLASTAGGSGGSSPPASPEGE